MASATKDPLLTVARIITWFVIAVLAFAAAAILISIPVVVFNHGMVSAELAKEGVEAGPELTALIALLLASIAGLLALAVWFLRLLLKIIDSVGEGDPFAPVNAVRLNRMAWISLAGYLAAIPIGALVIWIAHLAREADIDADFDFGGGLLLSLILFILARVFRKGAEMREDLEGTV